MRRSCFGLFVLFALLTAATNVFADGIHLRWDACLGDAGVSNKNFACNTNSGSEYLYVSYVSSQPIADVTGVEVAVHLHSVAATMPSWWSSFTPSSCRPTAFSLAFTEGAQSATCQNTFAGNAAGGLAAYTDPAPGATNYKQLLFVLATGTPFTVQAGTEYFAGRIAVSHVKTVGTGSCSGCNEPVCIGLNVVDLTRSPTPRVHLTDESFPGSSYVSWQNAVPSGYVEPVSNHNPYPYRTVGCSLPIPARNSTWGTIKSQYH